MPSSEVEARMFVRRFSLTMLTSMSSSREFSPTTMPSYTRSPGSTNIVPRSCTCSIAYPVTLPGRSATSAPVMRCGMSPCQGS